jgi:signal peptidase I
MFIALGFGVRAFYIPSGAMRPTLREKDRLWVNMLTYRFSDPKRGDIIVFYAPPEASYGEKPASFIKRVIGLPGETIEVKVFKGVYINGAKLNEPYIPSSDTADYDWGPERIPAARYFVLGDNRRDSNDSHRWGFLSRSAIRGKVFFRFAPPSRMGAVR